MKMKRFFGILLSLVMVLGLMPGMSLTAYAEDLQITIDPVGGGTVAQIYKGVDIYQCTATPAEGYRFVKWTYKDMTDNDFESTENPKDIILVNVINCRYG